MNVLEVGVIIILDDSKVYLISPFGPVSCGLHRSGLCFKPTLIDVS